MLLSVGRKSAKSKPERVFLIAESAHEQDVLEEMLKIFEPWIVEDKKKHINQAVKTIGRNNEEV